MLLEGANILLCVCGGIAAYKSCELTRMLVREGASVRVALTPTAAQFVTPLTFTALSSEAALVDEFPPSGASPEGDVFAHLNLPRGIDCLVVCPATATTLGKMAHGIGDNLVTASYLSCSAPVIVAPAMNTRMWANPAVQANVALLADRGVQLVPPIEGELACGDEGEGKLADVRDIFAAIADLVNKADAAGSPRSPRARALDGRRIVVTAGGTREYLDPVRFITNASTGRLARDTVHGLASAGAEVILVDSGIEIEPDVARRLASRHEARTAFDMLSVLSREMEQADGLVMLAAVADYSPSRYLSTKRKKDGGPWKVEFSETTDVLATVAGRRRDGQLLLGVSLEDTDWVDRAVKKTAVKHVDAILAVELGGDLPFGDSRINCALVDGSGVLEPAGMRSKPEAAALVVDFMTSRLGAGEPAGN